MNDVERIREEWLVVRCQRGETDALRQLVESMQGRLLYFTRRLVHDEAVAFDVLQEVWETVFKRIRLLRNIHAFRTWIYQIAHDKAVNRIRREVARAKAEEQYTDQARLQDDANWEAVDASRVHEAIGSLNPIHREVITLFFLEDMTYEEIAEVTGCSIGTVKSRMYYAKASLRRLMEEKFHE